MTNQETQIEALKSMLAESGWQPEIQNGAYGVVVRIYLKSFTTHKAYIQFRRLKHDPYEKSIHEIDTLMDGASVHHLNSLGANKYWILNSLLRKNGCYDLLGVYKKRIK